MHSGSVKMAALFTGTSAANRTAQHELKSDAVYSWSQGLYKTLDFPVFTAQWRYFK
jgi:hypothetical protein